jgi:hypothetical protein
MPDSPSRTVALRARSDGPAPARPDEVARPALEVAGHRPRSRARAQRGAGPRAEPAALVHERGVGHRPSVVLAADHRVVGHPRVGHEHLVEEGPTRHLAQRAHVDPRLMHGEREVGDPLVLGDVGVGAGQEHAQIGILAARRPDLLTVHDPLVAVPPRPALQPGQVRTGGRFTEQLAPRLPAGHDVAHVGVDLLTGPVAGDGRGGEEQSEPGRSPEGPPGSDPLLHPEPVGARQPAAVGVHREGRGGPTGQAQSLPPLGDGEVRVPVVGQPIIELAEERVGSRGRICCGHLPFPLPVGTRPPTSSIDLRFLRRWPGRDSTVPLPRRSRRPASDRFRGPPPVHNAPGVECRVRSA